MKYLIILMALATSACTTVPVTAKFPEPPGKQAMITCPGLQKLTEDAKLSDISKTIAVNYTTYYECAIKLDAWIEWYGVQKIIYENAK